MTPAYGTASLTISHYLSSPGTLSQVDEMPSPPRISQLISQQKPMRAKRGRPSKNQYLPALDSSFHDSKRPKSSINYPCPDCSNIFEANRWSEHVRRVHFPEYVWECPKVNERTSKPCRFKPFSRTDGFAAHLRGEHSCDADEISALKQACRFRTRNLYHHLCGFCDEELANRDESVEHIKNHFKEISERSNPPPDLGISEWREKCTCDHSIKRGTHYALRDETEDKPTRDEDHQDEDRDGGDEGTGQGDSNFQPQDPSPNQDGHPPQNNYSGNVGSDFYCQHSSYSNCTELSSGPAQNPYKSSTIDLHESNKPASSSTSIAAWNSSAVKYQYSTSPAFGIQEGGELLDSPRGTSPQYGQPIIVSFPYPPPRESAKNGSPSPCLASHCSDPYPPPHRLSITSHHSDNVSSGSFDGEDFIEKGRCTYPECGKAFKDLKAHMLTHQNNRPEKCPIQACDYHAKGFARKYDRNRHLLTHYKGKMVCGFCPGSGTAAEKSFNRADVFKRHLTSAHAVEQTPPNSRKKSTNSVTKTLSGYAPDAPKNCSICSLIFSDAQDFYEHLDDCILRVVNQEEPWEAINARRLAEVEPESITATKNVNLVDEKTDQFECHDDDDFAFRSQSIQKASSPKRKTPGIKHSKCVNQRSKMSQESQRPSYFWGCVEFG